MTDAPTSSEGPARGGSPALASVAAIVLMCALVVALCAAAGIVAWVLRTTSTTAADPDAAALRAAVERQSSYYGDFDVVRSEVVRNPNPGTATVYLLQRSTTVEGFLMLARFDVSGLADPDAAAMPEVSVRDWFFTDIEFERPMREAFMRRWVTDHGDAPVIGMLGGSKGDGTGEWTVQYQRTQARALDPALAPLETAYVSDDATSVWRQVDASEAASAAAAEEPVDSGLWDVPTSTLVPRLLPQYRVEKTFTLGEAFDEPVTYVLVSHRSVRGMRAVVGVDSLREDYVWGVSLVSFLTWKDRAMTDAFARAWAERHADAIVWEIAGDATLGSAGTYNVSYYPRAKGPSDMTGAPEIAMWRYGADGAWTEIP